MNKLDVSIWEQIRDGEITQLSAVPLSPQAERAAIVCLENIFVKKKRIISTAYRLYRRLVPNI